eukprot:gene47251-57874_t
MQQDSETVRIGEIIMSQAVARKAHIELRPFASLGAANHGWLDAHHHFSFSEYRDPARDSWGALRVWNDDAIAAQAGFPPHPHRDMEIITYVRSGAITRRDSMRNTGRTAAGDVQVMSAGTGVQHSEFNHAEGQTTHFLQIWIEPNVTGIPPSYEQKTFAAPEKRGQLKLVASNGGVEGSVTIHADARIYAGLLDADEKASFALDAKRKTYVHLVRGELDVNGQKLQTGDAALIEGEDGQLELAHGKDAEVL